MTPRQFGVATGLAVVPFGAAWGLSGLSVNVVHLVCGSVLIGFYWGQLFCGAIEALARRQDPQ